MRSSFKTKKNNSLKVDKKKIKNLNKKIMELISPKS